MLALVLVRLASFLDVEARADHAGCHVCGFARELRVVPAAAHHGDAGRGLVVFTAALGLRAVGGEGDAGMRPREEQWVLDSGEAGRHRPLEDDDRLRLIDVENRHAGDRTRRVVAGIRIDDVVCADHDADVRLFKRGINRVHFFEFVVFDVSFGHQHVHVSGHATGDWVNGVLDLHAL